MSKAITISLATKCQLLFGLAVLVIIAGALAVPWQRMEQLASQQNVRAARALADLSLREAHRTAADRSTARWNAASLPDLPDYAPPVIHTPASPLSEAGTGDPLADEALKLFRAKPKETETGRFQTLADGTRLYRYAAAVRLEPSCLKCHQPWRTWVSVPATSAPATRPGDASAPATAAAEPATQPFAATTQPIAATTPATQPLLLPPPSLAPGAWPVVAVVRVDLPWRSDDNQVVLNRMVIVVSGMLGGTLAIVVFYLITSRLILQPVRVLRNTAEKVSKGDLNIRSAISTGDEFQQLAETFNTMLATLKASQDQLEATNRSLDTRVGELAKSNTDLFEANRFKSEFLTNVTHELRTPLNAIIGFTELLSAKVESDPKGARYTENILESAKRLLQLINDLLDLAKIEAGKLVLRKENINVADLCEAMRNFMLPLAQKKDIDLTFAPLTPIPLVHTDPARLQQIVYNFLANAIKFTPKDGKVALTAKCDDPQTVRISVADTGPGIAPEDQQVIFEKFRQLDGSVTRQHSGTGLGLAISKELAEMLGGKIELSSVPGKGATFSLLLPIAATPEDPKVHPSDRFIGTLHS